MKHKIFIAMFLSLSAVVFAQQKSPVSGTVTDKAGLPLEGVAVIERGVLTNGVMTDSLGRFSINVSSDAFLEISSIGYKNVVEHVKMGCGF